MQTEKAAGGLTYFSSLANPIYSNNKLHADSSPEKSSVPSSDLFKEKPRRGRRRLLHDEEQRKARRKAQCKLNQRRYRAKQRKLISTLSLETEGMKGHLETCQDYRNFLRDYFMQPFTVWNDERPILVANHFLQTFRAGFALQSTESSSLQENFIRLVCAPELVAQGATTDGIEAFLLQLKRYTSYHGNLEMQPQNVTVIHAPKQQENDCAEEQLSWIVQARGSVKLRISRDTLMLVYPHVMRHHTRIAHRVAGQTIEPNFTMTFYFNTHAKVTKLDQHVDFAGAFFRLLESAEDVATMLEGAMISQFSELGLDPQDTAAESALTRGCKQLSLKYILL
ncbi:hypothetical protein DD237_008121 [Peronospora effusa]|uniref:BZIP domain-containing protein n=1 Tax=Peronospora effusa TaxID=542832 RepID=A0A3R7WJ65_9STRA|nr:hypothetical protein DD237_008121 [Peronospora effusa]